MTLPLVSICVPTYNGARYIGEAIESALAQTADPQTLELLVSDSGSTDDTLDRVRRAAAGSPFPVRVLEERTPGMVANWNATVRAARGRYVKFLFQDDRLATDCIERMVRPVRDNPNVGLVFSRRELLIDAEAENMPTARLLRQFENLHHGFRRLRALQPGAALLGDRALLMRPINKIGEPTVVLLDRQKLIDIGLFNLRMKQLVDLEAWLRMLAVGDVAFVDAKLASFRVHAEQMTAKNYVTDTEQVEYDLLYSRLHESDLYPLLHAAARYTVRQHALIQSRDAAALGVSDRVYAAARAVVHWMRGFRRPQGNGSPGPAEHHV